MSTVKGLTIKTLDRNNLRPCPFCGSRDVSVIVDVQTANRCWYRVLCCEDECGALGAMRLHVADAERAWNRREGGK